MESYERCALRNIETKRFIGKTFDHVFNRMESTKSMKSALKFADQSDASEWLLNAPFAPKDTNNYEYVIIETELREKEVIPHVRVSESPAKAVSG